MKAVVPVFLSVFVAATAYSQAPSISAAGIVNAASYAGGAISPGEIVVIYGNNIGPSKLINQTPTSSGYGNSLSGVQVLIGGFPAPILYAGASQVSVIVPYEVASPGIANVTLSYNGTNSNTVMEQVTATQLGIFSADSSGNGSGAILDANYRPISAANPASPGQVITVYGTGEGLDQTTLMDGQLVPAATAPKANITATVGGMPATVLYAGGSPGLVAGLLQVNITIPSGLVNCSSAGAPVVISSGAQSSQLNIVVPMTKAASCPADLSFKSATINGQYTVKGLGTYSGAVSINSNGDGTYTVKTLALLPALGFTLIFPTATISGNVVTGTTVLMVGTDVGGKTPSSGSFTLAITPNGPPSSGATFVTAMGTTMGASAAGSVTATFSTSGMYDGFIQQ